MHLVLYPFLSEQYIAAAAFRRYVCAITYRINLTIICDLRSDNDSFNQSHGHCSVILRERVYVINNKLIVFNLFSGPSHRRRQETR